MHVLIQSYIALRTKDQGLKGTNMLRGLKGTNMLW
jgi:hypothetical protein